MQRMISFSLKLCLLFALAALVTLAHHYGLLQTTLDLLEALGPWAAPAFVGVYALTCVLFFPSVIFTLAGGTLFGFWGIPLSLAGTGLGSTAAFLIGRTLARKAVEKKFKNHKSFKTLELLTQKRGWQIVALARLSPVFPFAVGNYAFGLTALTPAAYFLASVLGTIPSASVYTYLGTLGGTAAGNRERTPIEWVLLIAGLAATIVLTLFIQRWAKKALADASIRA